MTHQNRDVDGQTSLTSATASKTQTGEQPQRPWLSLITTRGLSRDIFALPAQN